MSSMPVVLATGGYDHKIRYLDRFHHPSPIPHPPTLSPIATFTTRKRLWDATSGMCTKSITFGETANGNSNNGSSQVNCLAVSSDKSLLAAGGNPLIHLYDINGTVNGATDERPLMYV